MKYYVLERLGLKGIYVQKLNIEDSNQTKFTDELEAAKSYTEEDLLNINLKRSIKEQQLKLIRVIPK